MSPTPADESNSPEGRAEWARALNDTVRIALSDLGDVVSEEDIRAARVIGGSSDIPVTDTALAQFLGSAIAASVLEKGIREAEASGMPKEAP